MSILAGVAVVVPGFAQSPGQSAPFRFGPFLREIEGMFDPASVAISEDGVICVAERSGPRLSLLKADGTVVKQWGTHGDHPGSLIEPRSAAIGADEIFVTDSGRHLVTAFDREGNFKREWGGHGIQPGRFNEPRGITVTGPRVFVADAGNNRVQIFDRAGNVENILGEGPGSHEASLHHPSDIAVDPQGHVYVADTGANRIVKFDVNGAFVKAWSEWGPFPGMLDEPVAIEYSRGMLFVTDRRNHRIQTFDTDGNFIEEWGTHEFIPHEGNGRLHYPDDLAIAPTGEFAVIAETIENRLQLFSPLPAGAQPEAKFAYEKSAQTHFGDHIDIDGQLMIIVEPENHFVFIFDISREIPVIINQFGERGEKFGLMLAAAGIDLDLAGRTILMSDRGTGRLQQFQITFDPEAPRRIDPDMTRFSFAWDLETLRASMLDPKPVWPIEPSAIRIDKHRNLYVVDSRNDQVHVFDSSMKFVQSWGEYGTQPGQFRGPTDLSFNQAGDTAFVVDSLNGRVQAIELSGKFRRAWTIEGPANGQRARPFGICSGKDGFVYVTDISNAQVLKYDEQGKRMTQWSQQGAKMGQLWKPRGLAQDDKARVFVIDQGNHRAQIFDADGNWLVTFGAGRAYTQNNRPRDE